MYGGQADAAVGGQRHVVIAHHGDIHGNAQALTLQAVDGGDRQHVVMGDDGGGAIVHLYQRQAAAGECSDETQAPALAAIFAQMLGDEGEPAMAETVEMLDDHLHRGRIVMVDDAEARIVGFAEGGKHDGNLPIEQHAGESGA